MSLRPIVFSGLRDVDFVIGNTGISFARWMLRGSGDACRLRVLSCALSLLVLLRFRGLPLLCARHSRAGGVHGHWGREHVFVMLRGTFPRLRLCIGASCGDIMLFRNCLKFGRQSNTQG